MSGVRLYIGGLGGSVDENVLKKHLATYGTVAQADIKEKKDAEGVIMTRFAYVNIEASNNQIQQCINSLNGSVWRGSRLKVERARESFMERLQRERAGNNQQQKGQQQAAISRQAQKPLQSFQKPVNKRPLVITEQNLGGTIKKKKIDKSSSESSESNSESSESDSSNDSDEVHNGIPMFRGTVNFGLDNEKNKAIGILNEKKKHVDKEETCKLKSTTKVKQHGDSGLFKESMVRSKDKVEEALLSNFKNFSSVWGDSDDEDDAVNDEEESGDDMSESGNEESKMEKEENAKSKDSSSISTEPGFFIDLQPAKVSSMQSGIAHNISRSVAANDDTEDDGIGDVLSERQNQLDILSNILGKPMTATELKADEKKGRQQMKRYDPTLPEHKQYEISREKQQQQQQQQQSASQELDKTEIPKEEMHTDSIEHQTLNQDKYIKVSQNLNFKEKSEGFSLLSMFSQKKADSSEDTDEEEEMAESSETITSTKLVSETAQIHKKKAKFFLNEHDAVIDEGIQWLSHSLTQEICDEFDKIRPELVQVYKTRMVRAKRDAKDSRGRGRGRVRVRGPMRDRQQNKSDQNKNFSKDKHPHQNNGIGMAKDGKFNSNRKFEGRGRGFGKGRGQIQGKG